ncbi:MAG: hypothetical protein Q9182_000945 [Xanthomendoza sp. 2 TL-2023]
MLVSTHRNMRFLSCILVHLTAISLCDSLPTIAAVRSPFLEELQTNITAATEPRGDGREPHQYTHLHKRRAEIHELEKRQQVNCTDPYALFFSECWGILRIHDYLVNPATGWVATTRTCQDSGGNNWDNDGTNCCRSGEAWSTCYLRLAIPGSNHDCTSTSLDRCDAAMITSINVDPSIRPYVRYTVKNIFALQNAAGIVGNSIETMIQVVDVIVQPSVKLQDILLSLAVGLAFLGAPSFATVLLGIKLAFLRGASQTFIIASQQAPNVGRALWPSGTDRSQSIQSADLHLKLGNISGELGYMMDGGVRLLMTDPNTFVNYADNGRYSGPNVTDTGENSSLTIPSGTDTVAYALKTFLVSTSLWQNKWYSTFWLGPFYTQESVSKSFGRCQFDDSGLCVLPTDSDMAIYWSPYTYRVYKLACEGPKNALKPREMVRNILDYGWAPLSFLFDGGFNCTAEGRAGSTAVNFNYDGTLDLACVSQLPMYTLCGSICPVTQTNGSCFFGDIGSIKPGACDQYAGWM